MWHHIDDSVVEEILRLWIWYYCSLVDRGLGEREEGEKGREREGGRRKEKKGRGVGEKDGRWNERDEERERGKR